MNAARLLILLYPPDFRDRFQGEILSAYEEGGGGTIEAAGLICSVAREWLARWTTPRWIRARWMPDWRWMRPAGVSRDEYFGSDPADLIDARKRADFCARRHRDSRESVKAHERLQRVRRKYGIA